MTARLTRTITTLAATEPIVAQKPKRKQSARLSPRSTIMGSSASSSILLLPQIVDARLADVDLAVDGGAGAAQELQLLAQEFDFFVDQFVFGHGGFLGAVARPVGYLSFLTASL